MHLDLFSTRTDGHIRKAQEYLQQANVARIEHQVAAEHHAALATMYAQRIVWLEAELSTGISASSVNQQGRGDFSKPTESIKRNSESVVSLSRLHRLGLPADAS